MASSAAGFDSNNFLPHHHNKDSPHTRAVMTVQQQRGDLRLEYFRKLRQVGQGSTGIVYVAELLHTNTYFAVKVKRIHSERARRVETERRVLQTLDNPLLPTLYFYCERHGRAFFVTEYCPGDLNRLRFQTPHRRFPEEITRFYVAEILLAFEYLHMLGILYRDLKPENVLVKDDGHLLLTDFDLSQTFEVVPKVIHGSSKTESSCFASLSKKTKEQVQFHAEPYEAHSDSFVGTQVYVAPEIVQEEGHGNDVDWWTLGIFMYELIYGVTPFEGRNADETEENIKGRKLTFPTVPYVSDVAKDLMKKLLERKRSKRLGHYSGAAQVKGHPFFEVMNWSLLLSRPPATLPTPAISMPSLGAPEDQSW